MKKIISTILFLVILLFFPYLCLAQFNIDAQVIIHQKGTEKILISNGFPLPSGIVSERIIRDGQIKILIEGKEVAANVSALRGRHHDGSLRSMLIQFTLMSKKNVLSAKIVIDGGERSYSDPDYQRPTYDMLQNNNLILPVNPDYICSTGITFQQLLPFGDGSASEEKQFTILAENRFDAIKHRGTATYEHPKGLFALWSRSGEVKYFNKALEEIINGWAGYNFPDPGAETTNADITNPDKIEWPNQTSNSSFQIGPEWHNSRTMSYAIAYLLTGYRDFWSAVAATVPGGLFYQGDIADTQQGANEVIIRSHYNNPRYNYGIYAPILTALLIDATIQVPSFWAGLTIDELLVERALNAIYHHEWNVEWIYVNNWDRTFPATGTPLVQGDVSATILGAYFDRNAWRKANERLSQQEAEPKPLSNYWWHRPSDNAWFEYDGSAWIDKGYFPTSLWLQLDKKSIQGGEFSTGVIDSGINGTIADVSIEDYRNGFLGVRSYGTGRRDGLRIFQTIFPANFLIDYYLNIKSDSRIPLGVYELLRIVLVNVRETSHPVDGDWHQKSAGKWGEVDFLHPYNLRFPFDPEIPGNPWILPEYARMIAFVIKTLGDMEVEGKLLSEWYEICLNTANNSPSHLNWEWKLFGQYYGISQDAPWIMAQESLLNFGPDKMRKPTQYDSIPGDIPDIARSNNTSAPVIKTISIDQ